MYADSMQCAMDSVSGISKIGLEKLIQGNALDHVQSCLRATNVLMITNRVHTQF